MTHHHHFHHDTGAAERGTRAVLWITLAVMVLEIVAGWWFGSMALLADGWHMGSHAAAIGVSAVAYAAARRLAHDNRFAFGTWKIEVLGGFASALLLLGVAVLMVLASVDRLFDPQPIRYREAIAVAIFGLLVNLVCAFILGRSDTHAHPHHHAHDQGHAHAPGHADLNLRSAYLHVLADAATSVLAIVALVGGWLWGWDWLDPFMGIVGGVLVAIWAKGLIFDTSRVLLDREMDHPVVGQIRAAVEALGTTGSTRVTDLHVWRVGRNGYACALTAVSSQSGLTPQAVRQALAAHPAVVHSTIELHHPDNA